jgi:protein gp37
MAQRPDMRFLVLTKQPQNITADEGGNLPATLMLGVTVEGMPRQCSRQAELYMRTWHRHYFVSAEPLFASFGLYPLGLKWLILGADSRRNPYLPGEQAFRSMIAQADDLGIPVYLKNTALKHYPGLPTRREFPEGLQLLGRLPDDPSPGLGPRRPARGAATNTDPS